jgi:hypothetical protein
MNPQTFFGPGQARRYGHAQHIPSARAAGAVQFKEAI